MKVREFYDCHGRVHVPARGAIARFDRNAIEIRVLDVQECLQADLAVCSAIVAVLHLLVERFMPLEDQHKVPIEQLHAILLTTQDQVQKERFPLTQEILGYMLGIRRTGVSAVASALKKRRIINYNRGMVEILNRQELESASCECYLGVKQEFERLFKSLLRRR